MRKKTSCIIGLLLASGSCIYEKTLHLLSQSSKYYSLSSHYHPTTTVYHLIHQSTTVYHLIHQTNIQHNTTHAVSKPLNQHNPSDSSKLTLPYTLVWDNQYVPTFFKLVSFVSFTLDCNGTLPLTSIYHIVHL